MQHIPKPGSESQTLRLMSGSHWSCDTIRFSVRLEELRLVAVTLDSPIT